MKYIVLELFDINYPSIVTSENGMPMIFADENSAKREAYDCQNGIVVCIEKHSVATHRLRFCVDQDSSITDDELNEIERLIDFNEYSNREYAGSFILTKSENEWKKAKSRMCCGIVSRKFHLDSNERIYFAFDYGH